MSWSAVAAVAELLGALAVLASLLYLANQIRQNTAVARSAARLGITQAAMAGAATIAGDAEISDLFFRSFSGEALEPREYFRLQVVCYMICRQYENIHYQFQSGMLSPDEWQGFLENLRLFFETDLFNRYWALDQRMYSPVFRKLVEEIRADLADSGSLGAAGFSQLMRADEADA